MRRMIAAFVALVGFGALATSAGAGVGYNLSGYGAGLAGSTNGADGAPVAGPTASWTNGGVAAYGGTLPIHWVARVDDVATAATLVTGAGPAPEAGSLLAEVEAYNAATDPDLPTDRVLGVGGKSWADPANAGQGWGHGLDYGLVDLAPLLGGGPVRFTVTLADDPADAVSTQLAFALYGGWDTGSTSDRHQTFTSDPSPVSTNPLGTTGLALVDFAVAATPGAVLARTFDLDATHGGAYTLFVGALGGVAGQYRLTITPEALPEGDADADGVADAADNCPAVANTDQLDGDADGLGDACDPFPTRTDHELAQCEADHDITLAALAAATADADGDGVHDATDVCPATPAATAVDALGCSQAQFCTAIVATTRDGKKTCQRADWRNDEPLMRLSIRRGEVDCLFKKNGRGPADDTCTPAP